MTLTSDPRTYHRDTETQRKEKEKGKRQKAKQEADGWKIRIRPASPGILKIMGARIAGIDTKQAPFFIRQVLKKMRKMMGKDLTPTKIYARVPRVFWVQILTEWLLGMKAGIPLRWRYILHIRTAARVGCPF
jgi:hypothetical protein